MTANRFAPAGDVGRFVREVAAIRWRAASGASAQASCAQERLQTVLRAALKTPFYRSRYDAAAARAGRLQELPPVTKEAFLSDIADTVSDGDIREAALVAFANDGARAGTLFKGKYVVAVTSGTTGQVGIFVNDAASWSKTRATTFAKLFGHDLNAPMMARTLLRGRYPMAFVVANQGHFMTSLLALRVPTLARAFLSSEVLSIDMPLDAIVERLNRSRPRLLHSYATILELLASEKRRGVLEVDPDIITSGSEPLTLSCRAALHDAFPRTRIVETYAATECVPMAQSCTEGTLHINPAACVIEPVDDDFAPVAPGVVSSSVLVTNLLNTAQPLVRYQLTDQVEWVDGRCPCGDGAPRIRVHGRADDTLFLRGAGDAWQAHPPIPFEIVFLRVPGLLQYRLIHARQNALRVLFVAEPGATASQIAAVLDDKLARYLQDHLLDGEVSYTIEQVERIARRPSGGRKLRQIVSRVPKPYSPFESAQRVRERRVPRRPPS